MNDDLFWEIPSSVDLEAFLRNHPPGFRYKIDHFYYIIDYLSKGMDMDDLDDNGGFINMNAQRLQKVNHNYKAYLDHLLNHRFINTDKKYIPGKKSFGYRLNSFTFHRATVIKILIKDYKVNSHKLREVTEHNENLAQTRKQYPHLTKWFDHLQIDADGATKEVEKLYPEQTGPIRGVRKGKASVGEKRYKAIAAIDKIANKEFYYSVDETVGRFHSNITNLKKELRNYITYDGQKLVNVDIKNSQPLFSTLLFSKDFYSKKSKYINIFNIPSILPLLSDNKYPYSSTIIMLVKALDKSDIQDINIFKELVYSGEFYAKISNILYPQTPFVKQNVKTMIFMIFFSRNSYMGQPKAEPKKRFKLNFPKTYEVFRLIKLRNHAALAHILQRIESMVMIQNVVVRISRERPELPIFTIHDSIVTTVGNEEYVSTVIKEEVLKFTGLTALLGKEYWE